MTLEQWLERATRKLAADSATKVRAEIEEHYASALERGADASEAMASLGDPAAANAEYRKVLLTDDEARLLKFWREPRGFTATTFVLLSGALAVGLVTTGQGMDPAEKIALSGSLSAVLLSGAVLRTPSIGNQIPRWLLWAVPVLSALLAGWAYTWFGFDAVTRFWASFVFITLVTVTAATFPIYTPESSRAFRPFKWAGLLAGTVILFWPTLVRMPWVIVLAMWVYAWAEWKRISIRKKLSVDQWPPELYR